jgi:valyl-tRNA synthetase
MHSVLLITFVFVCYIIIGTDHAGIATQLQVEKALIAEGKSYVH